MIIRTITKNEAYDYDKVASECGSAFYSSEWTGVHKRNLIRFGFFDNSERLIGGFHIFRQRKWGLTILRNPPFTPFCGPFFKVEAKNPVAILENRRRFLMLMAEFLDQWSCSLLFISMDRWVNDTLPFFWRGFKVIPGYTYILNLSLSIDEITKSMSPRRRNDISKAVRDGLRAEMASDPQVVFDLVQNTFDRQEKGFDRSSLHNILNRFAKKNNSYAFVTFQGEVPLACCFVILDGNTAYYLLGGYRSDVKHHGAGALALFEAIKYAKNLGIVRFDFEGSIIPPIERFFRGFGGQLTPFYTINKGLLPIEMILKFIKRERF